MTKQDALQFIAHGFTLASLPESFQRLNEIQNDPHSDIDDVVAVVKRDVELATSLLKLANSSIYNQGDPVSSIEEAAQKLGMKTIVESSLALGMIKAIDIDESYFDIHAFWKRSLSIAYLAESVHKFLPNYLQARVDRTGIFAAGLLHDMGLLVLIQGFPDTLMGTVDYALNEDIPLQEAEMQKFNFTHQDVGRILFKRWKLPEQLLAVAGYHHKPLDLKHHEYRTMVDVIHIADYICSNRAIAEQQTTFKPTLFEKVWERSGIKMELLPDITDEADKAAEAADFLLHC